ncbi:MAG: DUF4440 domain-containing protein [Saprospiraceae bacterium]|nr:DUF4440 domain-containing protein [Saprospiraceae bacterium]
MKHLQVLSTFFLILFTLNAVTAQKDVSDEIGEANARFMELFASGDVDAFMTMYTDDARILPPNSPVIAGREAVKEFWAGMMAAGITPKLKTTTAHGFGKTAIEEGTVGIYAGDTMVDEVKYIVIWKKVDGQWKLHQDIWNSNMPVPGG